MQSDTLRNSALLAGRNPKLTTAADKNTYAGSLNIEHDGSKKKTQSKLVYTTQWSGKWEKMCFHSPASFSNEITLQNTRFHWSLLKSPGHLTLHNLPFGRGSMVEGN